MCRYCNIYNPPLQHRQQVIHDLSTALTLISKYFGPKHELVVLLTTKLEEQKII